MASSKGDEYGDLHVPRLVDSGDVDRRSPPRGLGGVALTLQEAMSAPGPKAPYGEESDALGAIRSGTCQPDTTDTDVRGSDSAPAELPFRRVLPLEIREELERVRIMLRQPRA